MPSFSDARKALASLAHGAHMLGQEAGKRVAPAAQAALRLLNEVAAETGGYAANNDKTRDSGAAAHWNFMSTFAEKTAKMLGMSTEDFWQAMTNSISSTMTSSDDGTQRTTTVAELKSGKNLKHWISGLPIYALILLMCVVGSATVTPVILALLGMAPQAAAVGFSDLFAGFIGHPFALLLILAHRWLLASWMNLTVEDAPWDTTIFEVEKGTCKKHGGVFYCANLDEVQKEVALI